MIWYSERPVTEEAKQLIMMAAENPVIQLDLSNFFKYVMSPNKEYSFVVLFTSNVAEVELSRQTYNMLNLLSDKLHAKSKFRFFGVVDIEKDSALFECAKICYRRGTGTIISKSSPMLMHFPPISKRLTCSDYIDLEDYSGNLNISKITESILYVWNQHLTFLHDKIFWAYAFVAFCIVNVSGLIWNDVNEPGLFFTTDGKTLSLVAGGIKQQTVLEYYCVMILMTAFGTGKLLVLQSLGSSDREESKSKILRIAQIVLGIGLMYGSFSVLHYTFHVKLHN